MTNTNFIGSPRSFGQRDMLTPYVGYKVLSLLRKKRTGEIFAHGPHHLGHTYSLSADSRCKRKNKCKDFENCSCGFYSYKDIFSAALHWDISCGGYSNEVLVEVALSQDVVVAEKGFRASHQRIKKIVFPSCWNCDNAGEAVVPHKTKYLVAGCNQCIADADITTAVSFEEFAKANSPEGYKDIVVTSVSNIKNTMAIRSALGVVDVLPEPDSVDPHESSVEASLKIIENLKSDIEAINQERKFLEFKNSIDDMDIVQLQEISILLEDAINKKTDDAINDAGFGEQDNDG